MLFNKKFDVIISIGEDCACTSYLRRFKLQSSSRPFDWLTKAAFETRIDLIVNDFSNFLVKENIIPLTKPVGVSTDEKHNYYKDTLLDFYFYHDFRVGQPFEDEFILVADKYARRISRMYKEIDNSSDILFVWWSRDKHLSESVLVYAYDKLSKKFNSKNICLLCIEFDMHYSEQYFADGHILAVKYDNISYLHNPAYNETMGNEQNNMKFFAKISHRISLKQFFKICVYKFLKMIFGIIPCRKVRRRLKDKLSLLLFHDKL